MKVPGIDLRFGKEGGPAAGDSSLPAAPRFLNKKNLDYFVDMRNALLIRGQGGGPHAIGVTSARRGEGKTRVSICLATAFALDPKVRVALVDGNMRGPFVHKFFRIPRDPGYADLILGRVGREEAVFKYAPYPLHILPVGAKLSIPLAELFNRQGFRDTMEQLKSTFDVVIVDTPALKQCRDAEHIGKNMDGLVLVIEEDKTQLPVAQEAKQQIEMADIPLLGVAMNRSRSYIPSVLNRWFGLDD